MAIDSINRVRRNAAICMLLALWAGHAPETVFSAGKNEGEYDAVILVGYLDQAWYKQYAAAFLKPFGYNADVYKIVPPYIEKKKKEMEAKGFRVKVVDSATREEFRRHLTEKGVRAVAWFAHGEQGSPGSVIARGVDQAEDVISPGELKQWAAEQWAKERGWNGKTPLNDWMLKKYYRGSDPTDFNNKSAEMNRAKFQFEYGYFHTCYSFDSKALASIMMKNDPKAEFYGYRGIKKWFDDSGSSRAAVVNGKIVIDTPEKIEKLLKANSGDSRAPVREADPDLEEVKVVRSKTVKPASSQDRNRETDPDLEEVSVRSPRGQGRERTGDENRASGNRETGEAEKPGASSGVLPNIVRTSWKGELTVQAEGEPAHVYRVNFTVDSYNRLEGAFQYGIPLYDEDKIAVKDIRTTGSYDTKIGRFEMRFDQAFLLREENYVIGKGNSQINIKGRTSLKISGKMVAFTENGREARGEINIDHRPSIIVTGGDGGSPPAPEPFRITGTWRISRIK